MPSTTALASTPLSAALRAALTTAGWLRLCAAAAATAASRHLSSSDSTAALARAASPRPALLLASPTSSARLKVSTASSTGMPPATPAARVLRASLSLCCSSVPGAGSGASLALAPLALPAALRPPLQQAGHTTQVPSSSPSLRAGSSRHSSSPCARAQVAA